MARVNVFFSNEMLNAVNAEAERVGTNRSALIQRALAEFLEGQRRVREEAETRCRMEEACKQMDELAEKAGDWDPVAIIRRFRDSGWQESP